MSKIQKYFGSLVATFALLITLVLGFANPASAFPYCDGSSGPEPDCASVVCVTHPGPGTVMEVNTTFELEGYVVPSQCPADYPTPNYIEVCLPFGGQPYCQKTLKPVDSDTLTWSSEQIFYSPGDREIVSTGFSGSRRVTRQNRLPITVE
ncbi:MAG: hypothetical protein F6K21_36095 [Symploca sp. SIO2D2]|nr:hypothetical protein [Symploca sp. SIO2D2]